MTDGAGTEAAPVRRVPKRGSAQGALTPDEVRLLAPHVRARRGFLRLRTEEVPTHNTYKKIMEGLSILESTCAAIDDALAGPHNRETGEITPDGLWPQGVALALAKGEISEPVEFGRGRRSDLADTTELLAADRETIYVRGSQIMSRLPEATPEQLAALNALFNEAWDVIDRRRG